MNIVKSRLATGVLLIIIASVSFYAGTAHARGTFSALDRVLGDYNILIADLNSAASVVKKKAETLPEKDRDKVDQTYKHMQEQAEKEKEARDEMDKLRQLLDGIFGNGSDAAPVPERRRP